VISYLYGLAQSSATRGNQMNCFKSYSQARAALPIDAIWSCSFGYPGNSGFTEYYRDASGQRWTISNGPWGDDWKMQRG
jgi:hypothetical protein